MHELTYSVANGLIKVTLLMMYCRIFTFRRIRWIVLITGFLSVCLMVTGIIVPLVQCRPIKKMWQPSVPGVPASLLSPSHLLLRPPTCLSVSAVTDDGCSHALIPLLKAL